MEGGRGFHQLHDQHQAAHGGLESEGRGEEQ